VGDKFPPPYSLVSGKHLSAAAGVVTGGDAIGSLASSSLDSLDIQTNITEL